MMNLPEEKGVLRVLDANINRVSEGHRVLEDSSRFVHENKDVSKELRELRHKVRKTYDSAQLILSRSPKTDPGRENSRESDFDSRKNHNDLIKANFKRVQEGIRSIEEHFKLLGHRHEAKEFEDMRFVAYELEKQGLISSRARTEKKRKQEILRAGGLYCITGEEFAGGRTTLECVDAMLRSGVKIIQYREKSKDLTTKAAECREILRATRAAGSLFIVNDDVSLALAVGADEYMWGRRICRSRKPGR